MPFDVEVEDGEDGYIIARIDWLGVTTQARDQHTLRHNIIEALRVSIGPVDEVKRKRGGK